MSRLDRIVTSLAWGIVLLTVVEALTQRPPDELTLQVRDWLQTARGKFEVFYAERTRDGGGNTPPDPAAD